MLLSRQDFHELFQALSEACMWRAVSEVAAAAIYEQVKDRVSRDELVTISGNLMGQDFAKPADLVKACREHRKILYNAAPLPALPAAPPAAAVCDEQIKFHRIGAFLKLKKTRRCPTACGVGGRCPCWAEVWAPAVTEAERASYTPTGNPLAAVLGTPAPEPQERDRHAA